MTTSSTLLGTDLPVVAAPMAGGPSGLALLSAVSGAGGFAFLAGGYKSGEALAAEIRAARLVTPSFGVNLFTPGHSAISQVEFGRYRERLLVEAERYRVELPAAVPFHDDDGWQHKLDLLLSDPVPVVSVTFGIPSPAEVTALRRVGSRVLITVTTPAEALAAASAGADGLIAQGSAAGGHSGTHDATRRIMPVTTASLTREVVSATGLPVVAAGGVDGPDAVADLLASGAAAVAVGTLLLRTDESGASRVHKDALADPALRGTTITRAFTGRPARALRNRFIDDHGSDAPTGYPALHHLTRPLRQAAAAASDPHGVHLWAGTGFRAATTGSAAAVITRLAQGI